MKTSVIRNINNLNIEEICKSISSKDINIKVEIFNINSNYKNSNNELENRNQNIIIIYHKYNIKFSDNSNSTQ